MRLLRSDIPLGRDEAGRSLPWIIAFMVYLAALALVGAMSTDPLVARWDHGLAGRLTVQVPAPEAASHDAPGKATIDRVLEALSDTEGVTSATAMGRDQMTALLEPWLGAGNVPQDLPLPVLISVTLGTNPRLDLAALTRRLDQIAPGTTVDDHQRWVGDLADFARLIEFAAAGIVLLVGMLAIITVSFVTRTGLAIHRQVIELLHLMGAEDSHIARQFQKHALRLGLGGGVAGLAFTVLTVILVDRILDRFEVALLPNPHLSPADWAILAALPVVAALIAAATARITVLRTLARMP